MLKVGLNNFQRPSSSFYLISVKKLDIFKQASKIVYSRQKMYTTMHLKLAKCAECSFRWWKMLYSHIKLYIVIEISKQSSEKCVEQAETVCNSIFSLFLNCILVVLFSSLGQEIYLHSLCDVKFYIAAYQGKT